MLSDRINGALTFRRGVYAEVEHDPQFTRTAWMLVVAAAFLNQLGANAEGALSQPLGWIGASFLGMVIAVVGFAAAAAVVNGVGRLVYKAEVTFDELVRTLGLAYIWNAVGFLGVAAAVSATLSCVVAPAALAGAIAGLVAWFRAVKEALDLGWLQVTLTVVLAFIVLILAQFAALAVMGLLRLSASAVVG